MHWLVIFYPFFILVGSASAQNIRFKVNDAYVTGIKLKDKKDYEGAEKMFQVALLHDQNHADSYANLASVQRDLSMKKYSEGEVTEARRIKEKAIQNYKKCLSLNHFDYESHFHLGLLLDKESKKDSMMHFLYAVETHPSVIDAFFNLVEKKKNELIEPFQLYMATIDLILKDHDYSIDSQHTLDEEYFGKLYAVCGKEFAEFAVSDKLSDTCRSIGEEYIQMAMYLVPDAMYLNHKILNLNKKHFVLNNLPNKYLSDFFDSYSEIFDDNLELLKYTTPQVMASET